MSENTAFGTYGLPSTCLAIILIVTVQCTLTWAFMINFVAKSTNMGPHMLRGCLL